MDGLDGAVLDSTDEIVDDGAELESSEGDSPVLSEATEGAEAGSASTKDDPYTTKFSREFRAAMKAIEASNPEHAKFAKVSRDNHARLFALQQLEPKGVDGVREKYALLESLAVGDARGADALTAMQEQLEVAAQTDSLLADGDPKAFEALGPEFDKGLAKLAGPYLDRVRNTDPAAYNSAILPHLVGALASSDLVKDFNALVDVLSAQNDPRFDDKTKMQFTMQAMARMSNWFNAQADKAGKIGVAPAVDENRAKFEQERTQFETEKRTTHWETKIYPPVRQFVSEKFDELFKPYQSRLKLDAVALSAAKADFIKLLEKNGNEDASYLKQINYYRKQGMPTPDAVVNFAKQGLNRHAKPTMEALIKARGYASFLAGGKPRTAPVGAPRQAATAPATPGVEIRTVKPPMHEIDHRNTPVDWLAQRKYRLTNGKVVQVRKT